METFVVFNSVDYHKNLAKQVKYAHQESVQMEFALKQDLFHVIQTLIVQDSLFVTLLPLVWLENVQTPSQELNPITINVVSGSVHQPISKNPQIAQSVMLFLSIWFANNNANFLKNKDWLQMDIFMIVQLQ